MGDEEYDEWGQNIAEKNADFAAWWMDHCHGLTEPEALVLAAAIGVPGIGAAIPMYAAFRAGRQFQAGVGGSVPS
jgi:hypothetical protein